MNETEAMNSVESVTGISSMSTQSNAHWMDSFRSYAVNYKVWLTEVAVLGGISFLIGFLLKNFGKHIIAALGIALLTIIGLQYVGVITLTIGQIATTIGLPEVQTLPELFNEMIAWTQVHVFGAISIVIGFILGWTIG